MRVLILFVAILTSVTAQQRIRVATYNIRFLDKNISTERANRLKAVIERLDADVIGLQEIDDRDALRKIFDSPDWQLVISDSSTNNQDVAVAVRKPLIVKTPASLNASDAEFLFPADTSTLESFFPGNRDILVAEIKSPGFDKTLSVLVVHAKSRSGGRATTDPRRIGAARLLLAKLEQDFDEKNFILLGDMNDNPDDESMNILETGNPQAAAASETTDGPFLINLAEVLLVQGHISHGATSLDIVDDKVNTTDPQSRNRNNAGRGTNTNTGKILFDQILIPMHMQNSYVQDSIRVFNDKIAIEGGSQQNASDHLPVLADFEFGEEIDPTAGPDLRIISALPNPAGTDNGREQFTVRNIGTASLSLSGWKARDRGMNTFSLSGSLAGGATQTITLPSGAMPLNNGGDSIALIDPDGAVRHQVTYTASQAGSGAVVVFP